MKVLSLSDYLISFIYSPQVRIRFKDVDLILGCGDLAYYYLEYVYNALDVPLCFVRGNHDKIIEYGTGGQRTYPHGGIDLHRRTYHHNGLILAGVEGSLRYRFGRFQYTQSEMWAHVLSLVPMFLLNRLIYGRAVDVIITHSPPAGIHDQSDLPHQGIKAFRWLIDVFQPRYFFHGHVHILRPDTVYETIVGTTHVINTYGFRETMIEIS
jgi:Icc-related predicted phosphoesterase